MGFVWEGVGVRRREGEIEGVFGAGVWGFLKRLVLMRVCEFIINVNMVTSCFINVSV